jgi:4-hydroxy-tetrahydrodipicolinate reductase
MPTSDRVIPIVVVGAAGRMGRMILECAGGSEEPYHLVGAVEAAGHALMGHELRELLPSAPEGFRLLDQIPAQTPPGTVAIIFATPMSTLEHLQWSEATGNPAVVGTTGFNEEQLQWIDRVARRAPILLAPNMSAGVNVLCELVHRAVLMLGPDYDVEIVEMHHRNKKDAPSGTARRLGEIALEARGGSFARDAKHGRHGLGGGRTAEELGMHALRGGDVVGDHTVILAGPGERIELTHRAHTRETFAQGALRAACWVMGRPPGLYDMRDVLGL